MITSLLCNDANTVGRGLSESGVLVAGKTADDLNHLKEICLREVCGSEVLNHIIKNEKGKLQAILLLASKASRNDFISKCENKLSNIVSMGLEKDAHEFGSADLKVELVAVRFFEKGEIIGIKCIILILDLSSSLRASSRVEMKLSCSSARDAWSSHHAPPEGVLQQ